MNLFDHSSISPNFSILLMVISHQWLKRGILLVLLFCGTVSVGQIASADTPQHRWAGDVPIMNGLSIEPELGFAFDSPNGRIVMIFASTKAPLTKIMDFYSKTLAQLGWRGRNGKWIRKDERLEIGVVQTERGPLWRIMLQPN